MQRLSYASEAVTQRGDGHLCDCPNNCINQVMQVNTESWICENSIKWVKVMGK